MIWKCPDLSQSQNLNVKPCGLGPAKSKAILTTSKILEKYHGVVPDQIDLLESLPGLDIRPLWSSGA